MSGGISWKEQQSLLKSSLTIETSPTSGQPRNSTDTKPSGPCISLALTSHSHIGQEDSCRKQMPFHDEQTTHKGKRTTPRSHCYAPISSTSELQQLSPSQQKRKDSCSGSEGAKGSRALSQVQLVS